MAKIIIHPPGTTREEIELQRMKRNLELSPNERMHRAFELIEFAMRIKGGPLKEPEGKGIILFRNKEPYINKNYKLITNTKTLYRPVGPKELKLIEESGWKKYPPRLPEQPIFYPVTNEAYAIQIARDWNVNASGSGFVTKFDIDADYVSKFEVQNVGAAMHDELWVPAEELEEFNSHILGKIEVTREFYAV